MKKFHAKVIVKMKPDSLDKSVMLEHAIEYFMPVPELSCHTGEVYYIDFAAEDQCEALHMIEKISQEVLTNEEIENFEIRKLEEFSLES